MKKGNQKEKKKKVKRKAEKQKGNKKDWTAETTKWTTLRMYTLAQRILGNVWFSYRQTAFSERDDSLVN